MSLPRTLFSSLTVQNKGQDADQEKFEAGPLFSEGQSWEGHPPPPPPVCPCCSLWAAPAGSHVGFGVQQMLPAADMWDPAPVSAHRKASVSTQGKGPLSRIRPCPARWDLSAASKSHMPDSSIGAHAQQMVWHRQQVAGACADLVACRQGGRCWCLCPFACVSAVQAAEYAACPIPELRAPHVVAAHAVTQH